MQVLPKVWASLKKTLVRYHKTVMKKPFQVLVKPVAGDCNLECAYCFYRPVNKHFGGDVVRHRMSENILEKLIKDFLSYRFDISVICWQGGEPTLAGLSFFEKVVELETRYGVRGQRIGNAFQTNGLLINDDWARFLSEYRFLVGLSLDGPEDIHNEYRRSRSGKGSFEKVMDAIEFMRRWDVSFSILTVVSSANERRAKDVYRFFKEMKFTEFQFIPCIEIDPRTGKIADFSTSPDGYAKFLKELYREWAKDDASVRIRTFDFFSLVTRGVDVEYCPFQNRCGSYLVVEHNGDVFPCDFFVTPDWKLGNINERGLASFFETPKQQEFSRYKDKRDEKCLKCRWDDMCYGGCPKEWLTGAGRASRKSYYCKSYRDFFQTCFGRS